MIRAVIILTVALFAIIEFEAESVSAHYSRTAAPRAPGTVVPWPKRLNYTNGVDYFEIAQAFNISIYEHTEIASCGIIERTANRYIENNLLFDDTRPDDNSHYQRQQSRPPRKVGTLTELVIFPQRRFICENLPHEDMDEDYKIVVGFSNQRREPMAILTARTNWGVLRGLETFSQLIYNIELPSVPTRKAFAIKLLQVDDSPRFKFRGFMLDTARHYIPVHLIKQQLDAMASVKFNVFHWHIVDDQSFPLKLTSYPILAERGAYRPNMVYTKDDVQDIVRFAADRGIRVIPELDTPGHTFALRSIPRLLTRCYNTTTGQPNGDLGPIDPSSPVTYKFLPEVFSEFRQMFADSYLHAGGDEVNLDCWKSNPDITKFMQQRNFSANYNELNSYYIKKVHDVLAQNNRTMIVWEEAFDAYSASSPMPKDVVVHVWKLVNDPFEYKARMDLVVESGHRALLSACWYLNLINYGRDWPKFYLCDPTDTPSINPRKQELILGGEACLWTEYSDETNLMSRIWPRAAPIAERLWSAQNMNNIEEFSPRLEQLRCRMRYRGIDAEPINGPGYC